mgnify:CR=1 FL=1
MTSPAALRVPRTQYDRFTTPMARPNAPTLRTFEVAALRADGTRSIAAFKAPALPLFESAFSAFARGVVLSAPNGGIAVEDLQPGDWLNTSTGEPAQVMWIGSSVIEVAPPTPIRLLHICLSRHAAIDVGGIPAETFHPGMHALRQVTHAQRDLFLSMFPHIAHATDFGPLAHPRAPEPDTVA